MLSWLDAIVLSAAVFIVGVIVGFVICTIGSLNSLAEDGIDIELVNGKWQLRKENIYGIRKD